MVVNNMSWKMDFEEIYETRFITEDIFFVVGRRTRYWSPRTDFGIVKNGRFHSVNVRKDLKLIIEGKKPRNDEEMIQRIENGDIIEISSTLLIETAIEMGYFVPVVEDNLRKIVKWFIHGAGMDYEYGIEWGNKIKGILTRDEKYQFKKWEKEVGYEDVESEVFDMTYRKYFCEDSELESALYVVMHSTRLLNCAIYLKMHGISEYTLHDVWNYLLCYGKGHLFRDFLFFSDWEEYDLDAFMEKWGIVDEVVERDNSLFTSANLRNGKDFKMATQIQSSIDDWCGTAVVVPINCKLSPLEIINGGESVHQIENDFYVKNALVVRD